jgi:hypothetical protein
VTRSTGRQAKLVFVEHRGSSMFVLVVVRGRTRRRRSHLRCAPAYRSLCGRVTARRPDPHYNQSTVNGVVPPVVNDQTEVWLDVTVGADGSAVAIARVPFVPAPGNRAVVLHAEHTDDHGTAGARLACLPVSWS